MYEVCMFKLSQPSTFLHGRWRKKLLSKFRTKSSVNTSIMRADSRRRAQVTGCFERQIFAKLSYSRKYRIDLFSHTKPIANLVVGLKGNGICFSPNNLKRKARCGSDLLEYCTYKLTKLCKSCGRGKFVNS